MSYGRDSSYGRGRDRSYGGGANRSFNRGSPAAKPVEVGDVTEISRKGDGILHQIQIIPAKRIEHLE
jgi:hypothetical protein